MHVCINQLKRNQAKLNYYNTTKLLQLQLKTRPKATTTTTKTPVGSTEFQNISFSPSFF